MDDIQILNKKLDYIIRQNNALLDMLNSLVKAYAKQNNLATEDNVEECEYLNDI